MCLSSPAAPSSRPQANPLNHKQPDIHLMAGSRGMLAAKQPLVVPMLLRLSHFRLSSYVVLVVSKQKGITLVFKTDPLQNVDISSTFDSIAVIQNFIQREIEGQLRQMFREDLPGIIHRLSQQWVKAKVEAPYLSKPAAPRRMFETASTPSLVRKPSNNSLGTRRPRSTSAMSVTSAEGEPKPKPTPVASPDSLDFENFDPTYGLRPEGVPTKSGFKGFSALFTPPKGLADLAEEHNEIDDEYDDDAGTSYDVVDWEDTVPSISPPPSTTYTEAPEYETIPAVGGGTVTRPRIYHSQSSIQSLASAGLSMSRPPVLRSGATTPARMSRAPSNPYFPEYRSPEQSSSSRSSSGPARTASTSLTDHEESSTVYMDAPMHPRRMSVTSTTTTANIEMSLSSSPPNHYQSLEHQQSPKIILRPSLNNDSIHHLSTLSHSNHTLSPYTHDLSHFTVRSIPPRGSGAAGSLSSFEHRQPVKARRKRTYRLGGKKQSTPDSQPDAPTSPPPATGSTEPTPTSSGFVFPHGTASIPGSGPPSEMEFDMSDMDRYFRSTGHEGVSPPGGSGGMPQPVYPLRPGIPSLHKLQIRPGVPRSKAFPSSPLSRSFPSR